MNNHRLLAGIALVVVMLMAAFQAPISFGRGQDRILGPSTCNLTVVPDDGSTSVNARAPSTRYRWARGVYLILQSELAAAGYQSGSVPTSIGWTYDTAPGVAGAAPLTIYMQNTADTTNTKSTTWATAITGMTIVHTGGTTSLPGAAGDFEITLNSPGFSYTGGGLYVAFDWGDYTGAVGTAAVVTCNSTGLVGGIKSGQSTTATAPTTILASNFRPVTRLRGNAFANDAAVNAVYAYGELPQGLVPAQVIRSNIGNKGSSPLTNLPVMLNVTGANAFSDSQNVASLASCIGASNLSFAGYTPGAIGSDTVAVSVPNDDANGNNSLSVPTNVTALSYSYKYPGTTATGGVGFTGATGAFVGKFSVNAANAVTDVKLEFPAPVTAGAMYRVAIYGPNGAMPSTTSLYVDAADRTPVAGPVTITLPAPVAVGPGDFYVGIQQVNTTNAGLSFDVESPIRSGQFFFASPNPPTAWGDFAPGNDFKINVGVNLQNPSAPTASGAVSRKSHAGVDRDINLPLTGTPGIECRAGGATSDYTMIVTFTGNVTVSGSPQAQVTSGSATIGSGGVSNGGNVTTAGNVVTIPLTNVTNAQTINVTLNNVNSASAPETPAANVVIPMSRLLADTNGNGAVNASDVSQTKGRIGQPLDNTNFRSDVNVSGGINSTDASVVKSNVGNGLP